MLGGFLGTLVGFMVAPMTWGPAIVLTALCLLAARKIGKHCWILPLMFVAPVFWFTFATLVAGQRSRYGLSSLSDEWHVFWWLATLLWVFLFALLFRGKQIRHVLGVPFRFVARGGRKAHEKTRKSRPIKLWLFASVVWMVGVVLFFLVTDSRVFRWGFDSFIINHGFLLFIPPVFLGAVYYFYDKLFRQKP